MLQWYIARICCCGILLAQQLGYAAIILNAKNSEDTNSKKNYLSMA
jgi:hypothetical protein